MKITIPTFLLFVCADNMTHTTAANLRGVSPNNTEVTSKEDDDGRTLSGGLNIMNLDEEAKKIFESYVNPSFPDMKYRFKEIQYDRIGISFQDLSIDPISETAVEPISLDYVEIRNGGRIPQEHEISESRTVTNSYTSTISEGFKSKVEVKASVSFKAIAKVESSASMETFFNSTKTETASETVTASWRQPLVAEPFSRYTVEIFQRRFSTSPKFTADIEIAGRPTRSDGPCIWAVGTLYGSGSQDQDQDAEICIPLKQIPGMEVTGERTAIFSAKGNFGSVTGRHTSVDIKCFDIETDEPCGREEWTLSEDGTEIIDVEGSFF